MKVVVHFYSYFKELAACTATTEEVAPGSTIGQLLGQLCARFPRLAGAEKATLAAVGVDYQPREYVLQEGDEVALFPPVQGG